MLPPTVVKSEVAIPNDAGPVEFKTLHVKLGRDVFKIERRSHIIFAVEEPMDGIHGRLHVDSVRLESLSMRRNDHSVSFRTSGLCFEPSFRPLDAARNHDRIALVNLCEYLSR